VVLSISHLPESIERATMFPVMLELLTKLKENYKLGFISNTTVFESVVLDKWGITSIFDVVSFSWEVDSKKPTEEIFVQGGWKFELLV